MVKNRIVALVFRVGVFGVALGGILVNTGALGGSFSFRGFMFYTILSCVLALVLFGMLIFRTVRDIFSKGVRGFAGYYSRFEFVCVINVLLTFVVYWVLLAPDLFEMGNSGAMWSFNNLSVHMIVPLGCLVDYVLFTRSRSLKYGDIYKVLIFPLAYFGFATVAGFLGYVYKVSVDDGLPVRFPYPFMDFDRSSVGAVVMYVAVLTVGFIVVGHVFYLFDRKPWRKHSDNSSISRNKKKVRRVR